ncbi:MAG: ThuA domain-containing protein [Kiritimatiellia bacterium]
MSFTRRQWLQTALMGSAGAALAARGGDRPRRVVLIAGPKSHGFGEHAHVAGCRLLAERLNRVPGLQALVAEEAWPADPAVVAAADALVFYCDGDGRHLMNGHEAELAARPELGLGFLHYATVPPAGPGFDLMKARTGGVFEQHWSVNPFWTAGYRSFRMHPGANGVRPFTIEDEWYYHMRFADEAGPGFTPLLVALPPDATLSRPEGPYSNNPHARRAVLEQREPQTMAWVLEGQGGGRGFGFTGGHYHWNWAHPDFRRLVLNAITWLAGAAVPAAGVADAPPTWDELMTPLGPPPADFDAAELRGRIAEWNAPR